MKKINLFLSIFFVFACQHHQLKTAQDLNFSLIYAASKNDEEKVVSLLAQGADVNHPDGEGKTGLFYAATCFRNDFTQALLKIPGIDVDHADNDGKTALFHAVKYGNPVIIEALLDAGAQVNHISDEGTTVLDIAHPSLRPILLEKGALTIQQIRQKLTSRLEDLD